MFLFHITFTQQWRNPKYKDMLYRTATSNWCCTEIFWMNPCKSHLVSSFIIKFINLGGKSVQLQVRNVVYFLFLFAGTWQGSALSHGFDMKSGKTLKPIGSEQLQFEVLEL